MGPQRKYFGESMEAVITFFFGKKRWGALANTKSLATRFIGNGIDALLLLFFERFSAVSQTKFSEFYFRNF